MSAVKAVLYAALNVEGRVVYSHESRENVEMNARYIKTPTQVVGLAAIAPPVAAGSVDTGMYALKAKAMAATAGPWQLEDDDVGSGPAPVLHIGQPDNYALRITVQHAHEFPQRKPRLAGKEWESLVSQCRANADFIAAANPTAILGLIERAEKAEAEITTVKALVLRFWTGQYFDGVTKGDAAEINEALK